MRESQNLTEIFWHFSVYLYIFPANARGFLHGALACAALFRGVYAHFMHGIKKPPHSVTLCGGKSLFYFA